MLRSLYYRVLRMHPPAFREHFADEMLSIFDHATARQGKLRLLLDGLGSLARQRTLRIEFWHQTIPATRPILAPGIPSFQSLEPFRPRASAVIPGLILSVTVFAATCFAIRYSWIQILHVRIPEIQLDRPTWMPEQRSPDPTVSAAEPSIPRHAASPERTTSLAPAATAVPPMAHAPTRALKRIEPALVDAKESERQQAATSANQGATTTIKSSSETYVGTYVIDSPRKLTVVITTENDNLTLSMSGRSAFPLDPVSETKFVVRGLKNCWVEFSSAKPNRDLQMFCDGKYYVAHRQ